MNNNDYEIPQNATIRQEYVTCGNPDCQDSHGPYFYAYWKVNGKLNKKYMGKSKTDYATRIAAKKANTRPRGYRK